MKPRGDSADGAAERSSGFFVTHFFEITEGNNLAKVLGKFQDGLANALDGFETHGVILRDAREAIPHTGRCAAGVIRAAIQGDKCALALLTAAHVVARDAEEISAEGSARVVKLSGLANEGHEDFLSRVLGEGRAAAHVKSEAEERTLPAAIDESESVGIARAQALHEVAIGRYRLLGHLP